MTRALKTLAAVTAGTVLATSAFAQSAREVRGPSVYNAIENEPAPKLIVDPPLPNLLAVNVPDATGHRHGGLVQIQYRVENVRIDQCSGRPPSTYLPGSGICT